jgi:hypothetical protein
MSVFMLSVVFFIGTQSVVMLNAIKLNVVAPTQNLFLNVSELNHKNPLFVVKAAWGQRTLLQKLFTLVI